MSYGAVDSVCRALMPPWVHRRPAVLSAFGWGVILEVAHHTKRSVASCGAHLFGATSRP